MASADVGIDRRDGELPPVDQRRIGRFRQILVTGRSGVVEGVSVDPFTASHVVSTHDRLSPEARILYRRLPARRMVDIAYNSLTHDLRMRSRHR
jgi:hypothetical protein